MNTTIHLTTDRAEATIDLEGGRLATLAVDGLELLVSSTERPTRWGSFPMIPWCGRLPYGELLSGGETYRFAITSPPHANHGFCHLQPWDRVEVGATSAIITTSLGEPWPFGGWAVQRFELDDTSLTVTGEVHAEQAMPAMIGWHPWFRRQLEQGSPAKLQFDAGVHYVTDDDDIPTGELAPLPPEPWNMCVTDIKESPTITWPDALTLRMESTFDHWVIFTEPVHAICVEPQSGPPNQVNANPVMAAEGEPIVGSMSLIWG